MYANTMAVAAYGQRQNALKPVREQEWEALARTTQMLRHARDGEDSLEKARALSTQYRLWRIFLTDLADNGNALPLELRKQLIAIGSVVLQEAEYKVGHKADFDFLIEINESIMEGLRGG